MHKSTSGPSVVVLIPKYNQFMSISILMDDYQYQGAYKVSQEIIGMLKAGKLDRDRWHNQLKMYFYGIPSAGIPFSFYQIINKIVSDYLKKWEEQDSTEEKKV